VRKGFENIGVEVNGLFNDEDLRAAAEELEPNSSAALLVWENVWAREVAQALRDAGGVLFDFARLPHEVVQAGSRRGARQRIGRRFSMALGRRGPGLVGVAARTAVFAGTATAVSNRVSRRQARRWAEEDQQASDAQMYQEQQQTAPAEPDYTAQLEQLAQLKNQGIISEDEFQAKKKQILGI
jgi:hypothetical protein